MNRLRFLAFIFLLSNSFSFSQSSYLFIKKGFNKKRIFIESQAIRVKLKEGGEMKGTITLLKDSSIFINNKPVSVSQISKVLLIKKPVYHLPDTRTMLLIGAGSVLTSIGLSFNNKKNRKEAIIAGPVIGFGPLLVRYSGSRFFRMLSRKKFKIGKKFHLQILDLRVSPQPQISF